VRSSAPPRAAPERWGLARPGRTTGSATGTPRPARSPRRVPPRGPWPIRLRAPITRPAELGGAGDQRAIAPKAEGPPEVRGPVLRMHPVAEALAQTAGPRLRAELRPYLSGPFGPMVRGYLPQIWWFRTGTQDATLEVAQDGSVGVVEGCREPVDVVITWTEAALVGVLTRGPAGRPPAAEGSPRVEARTPKGQAAVQLLRRRLGL
jgi:hypothetical protein